MDDIECYSDRNRIKVEEYGMQDEENLQKLETQQL